MRSTTLVLLRHGSSIANEGRCFGGWDDVPLAESGVAQARLAGEQLKELNLQLDLCVTSVLRRAIWTAWHCLDTLGQPWMRTAADWRLNERHYGALQGMKKAEAAAIYGAEQVHRWRRGFNDRPPLLLPGDLRDSFGAPPYAGLSREEVPMGESLQDTQSRVLAYWHTVVRPALQRGRGVLVVAHGNSIRALLMELEHLNAQEIASVEVANGVPIVFDAQAGTTEFVRRNSR
jgi:2,3-bisphosphoglycerate-dependent phosphoglycerate mutase